MNAFIILLVAAMALISPASAGGGAMTDGEIRERLIAEAAGQCGTKTPDEAASVWAKGLMKRSAAYQFCVMTAELQAQYRKDLADNCPNWVTGQSSPWVSGYEIIGRSEQGRYTVLTLSFDTATSDGPWKSYAATLWITKQGGFARIANIKQETGLYPWTRFGSPTW